MGAMVRVTGKGFLKVVMGEGDGADGGSGPVRGPRGGGKGCPGPGRTPKCSLTARMGPEVHGYALPQFITPIICRLQHRVDKLHSLTSMPNCLQQLHTLEVSSINTLPRDGLGPGLRLFSHHGGGGLFLPTPEVSFPWRELHLWDPPPGVWKRT